jgi:hypothetical protein
MRRQAAELHENPIGVQVLALAIFFQQSGENPAMQVRSGGGFSQQARMRCSLVHEEGCSRDSVLIASHDANTISSKHACGAWCILGVAPTRLPAVA